MSPYHRFTLEDRINIEVALSHLHSFRQIAQQLGRSPGSICREVKPWTKEKYRALKAQAYAQKAARFRRAGKCKIPCRTALAAYIRAKLDLRWSPEQLSNSLKTDFPDDPSMHVSHETIYRYVYLHCKKTLREELTAQLRRQKKRRGPTKRKATDKRGKIADAVSIDERPEEVLGRVIPGHWEGDLVIGKGHRSAIGTLVERTTRTILIIPLTGMDATTVRQAFEGEFVQLPLLMRKTMTYDNGKEMTEHKKLTANTKVSVYFAHPYSPWERPTNENSNMLIRDYFPKGTDFNLVSPERLKEVQHQLNTRPRKTLEWQTPQQVFHKLIEAM